MSNTEKDTQTVNAIKWAGRWSIFIVALIATGLTLATWQWSMVYAAMLLTNGTIFLHAAVLMREWWIK